jgi:hypothetical protein
VKRSPFKRSSDGTFRVRLSAEERQVLRSLPEQVRQMMADKDPDLVRLFPPAYLDDEEHESEYQHYMREELIKRRLESLSVVEDTVDATHLTEEQVLMWMRVINDIRLILGTKLDVSEDNEDATASLHPTDPRAPLAALYWFLSFLLESTIEALQG